MNATAEPMDVADTDLFDNDNKNPDDDQPSSTSSGSGISKYYYRSHPSKKNHLFGRQRPLHVVLGSGKSDVILWRNKQTSGGIFAGATILWLLFEWIGYHILTFVCHSLILSLTTLFLWSNVASYVNISPPEIPKLELRDGSIARNALIMRRELNQGIRTFKEIVLGKNFKRIILVTLILWVASHIGGWFDFLTLVYLAFVMLLTLPMMYEKHEDTVDAAAEKVQIEIKQQYALLDNMVLQKLPGFQRDYKQD